MNEPAPPANPQAPVLASVDTKLAALKADLATSLRQAQPGFLSSGQAALDAALGGGLPLGKLCEWGLPPGKQGRAVLLPFLAHSRPLALWAYPGQSLAVYPPAWEAQGVDLGRLYFAKSSQPVRELRPIFLEPLFKLIVLDCPSQCSQEEQAFLSKQAKAMGFGILLLRPYLLSHAQGNPLAPLRLNSWWDHHSGHFQVETLRGFPERKLSFALNHKISWDGWQDSDEY